MKLAEITPVFNYNNRLNRHGEAAVHVRIYFAGKRRLVSTGVSVSPECWDDLKLRVKGHPKKDIYNFGIRDIINQIEQNQQELLRSGADGYTVDDLLNYHEKNRDRETSLVQFMRLDLDTRVDLKAGTRKNHKSFLKRFCEYRQEMLFADVNYSMLKEYEQFLRSYTFESGGTIKNLSLTRVAKHLKTFHSYINRAIKEGYLTEAGDPFRHFDWSGYYRAEKQANKRRRHLDPADVRALEALQFAPQQKHLEVIRDFFLVQCYTGLSYGDMIGLRKHHFKHKITESGSGLVIEMARKKTDEPFYVPVFLMSDKAESLFKKYLSKGRPYVFDQFTDVHINRELKKLAVMAGINEKITTHVGRHTCAMWLLHQGTPIEIISKILGHTNIKTTEIYAMIDQRSIDQAFIKRDQISGH